MAYFAYCIAYFPGWIGRKIWSKRLSGAKIWLKCPCLHGGCRDSIQVSQGYQRSALPTKLQRANDHEVAMELYNKKRVLNELLHNCFVPNERAKLLTYHHLHPSPVSCVLSQAAPGNSADSLRIAYGNLPVDPTGTRGRRPSTEDTGMKCKTCALSWRK